MRDDNIHLRWFEIKTLSRLNNVVQERFAIGKDDVRDIYVDITNGRNVVWIIFHDNCRATFNLSNERVLSTFFEIRGI